MFKVNRAWYYERLRQKGNKQAHHERVELKSFVEGLLKDYAGYGVRRVTKAVQKAGFSIGHKKIRRLLKAWGLAWQPLRKKKPPTTVREPHSAPAENKLAGAKQHGELNEPNRGWVGDVVYVSTKQQSGYLATLLDLYTR